MSDRTPVAPVTVSMQTDGTMGFWCPVCRETGGEEYLTVMPSDWKSETCPGCKTEFHGWIQFHLVQNGREIPAVVGA